MDLVAILSLLQTALLLLSSVQNPAISQELKNQAIDFSYQVVELATQAVGSFVLPQINEAGVVIEPQLAGVIPSVSLETRVAHKKSVNEFYERLPQNGILEYWIKGCNPEGCYNPDPIEWQDRLRFILHVENDDGLLTCSKYGDWSGDVPVNRWAEDNRFSSDGILGIRCLHNGIVVFDDEIDLEIIYRETTN